MKPRFNTGDIVLVKNIKIGQEAPLCIASSENVKHAGQQAKVLDLIDCEEYGIYYLLEFDGVKHPGTWYEGFLSKIEEYIPPKVGKLANVKYTDKPLSESETLAGVATQKAGNAMHDFQASLAICFENMDKMHTVVQGGWSVEMVASTLLLLKQMFRPEWEVALQTCNLIDEIRR
jgi:hypothetical protein